MNKVYLVFTLVPDFHTECVRTDKNLVAVCASKNDALKVIEEACKENGVSFVPENESPIIYQIDRWGEKEMTVEEWEVKGGIA